MEDPRARLSAFNLVSDAELAARVDLDQGGAVGQDKVVVEGFLHIQVCRLEVIDPVIFVQTNSLIFK